ncbi:hypothetical protein L2E82_44925 [Cichorium intybus]|uniref:Uncharacterized protein n=1 Tax=Cichorium intybus TaxID=13427 RepID=A0ACB8ZSJ4_CICIN|nr:hypothetical protein L2E82_44925 [Cichorium intybus]
MSVRLAGYPCSAEDSRAVPVPSYRSQAFPVLSNDSQAIPVPPIGSRAIPVPSTNNHYHSNNSYNYHNSRIIKPFNNSNMILHDLSSKERPGRRLDGVAGSFQHFSLSENPTTRSQVIGLVTVLAFELPSAHLLTL